METRNVAALAVTTQAALVIAAAGLVTIFVASEAPSVRAQTSQPVGRTTRAFADPDRPRWNGSGARPIATTIWYPAVASTNVVEWYLGPSDAPLFRLGASVARAAPLSSSGLRSLIVLSHGTGGSPEMLAWLAEPLAAAGYIVAAVSHHGNTASEPEPSAAGFMLWWERATDLSRLIDRLLDDPEFRGVIDSGRIGAAGFSLGGYTVVALAGGVTSLSLWEAFCRSPRRDNTCVAQPEFPAMFDEFAKIRDMPIVRASLDSHSGSFRDSRIRAVVALAPVGSMLTEDSLRQIPVPVQLVVGGADATTPAPTNAERLAVLIPNADLAVLPNVSHYTFLAECLPAGRKLQRQLCADGAGVDRAVVHSDVATRTLRFFDATLH